MPFNRDTDYPKTDEDLEHFDEDDWIPTIPGPRYAPNDVKIDLDDYTIGHAEGICLGNRVLLNEGANFYSIADGVSLISVRGSQFIHHDRHTIGQTIGLGDKPFGAEHTWNYVLSSDGGQLLLVEVKQGIFEHLSLDTGTFVYFNTLNRHFISRSDPQSMTVICQVFGYGPNQAELAAETMMSALRDL